MKIAFFIPSFGGGGAERVMINLANGFASKGIDVYLVVFSNQGVYKKELSDNIKLIDINSNRALFSYFAIKSFINKEKPQILYSTLGHVNILLLIVKLLSINDDYKLIIRESSTPSEVIKHKNNIGLWLTNILKKVLYPFANLIIAPSKGVSSDLNDNYKIKKRKMEVINNPIDFDRLNKLSKMPLDDYYKIQSSRCIIGIGTLKKCKDFETLIKAFSIVKKTHNCKLIILGEGPERQPLENYINELNLEEHVYMPGFVTNPFNYLKASDVFVLSSLYEGSPNVLIQAMLLGVPCVSTNCKSGPEEILMNGKYGQLIEIGDQLGMSKAIINVFEGKWKNANINGLEKKYNLEKLVNQYLDKPVFNNENN